MVSKKAEPNLIDIVKRLIASGIVSPRATFAEIMSAMPTSKKKASEIPFEKRMETLEKLGLVETFDPEEADALGAFEETALSDEDALDAVSLMTPAQLEAFLKTASAKIEQIDPSLLQLPFSEAIKRIKQLAKNSNRAGTSKETSRKKTPPPKSRDKYEESLPVQLSLFGIEVKKEYTNQFDFWSFVPRFVYGRQGSELIAKEGGKATIERQFRIDSEKYSLMLQTYKLKRRMPGKEEFETTDCFLGEREEFVEEALIKMACTDAIFLDGQAALDFTIQKLQEELAAAGHSYAYNELIDSLLILNGSVVTIFDSRGDPKYQSQSITAVGFKNSDDKKKHSAQTKCFVIFHPSITEGIKNGSYRQAQYKLIMGADTVAERKLYKRIAYFFTQASWTDSYEFSLVQFLENSGLKIQETVSGKFKYMKKKVLQSMQDKKIIREFGYDKITNGRAVVDYKIRLFAGHELIAEIKRANSIQRKIQGELIAATEKKAKV